MARHLKIPVVVDGGLVFFRFVVLVLMMGLVACEGTLETDLESSETALDSQPEPQPIVSTRKPPAQPVPETPPENTPETQPETEPEPEPEVPEVDPAEPGLVIEFRIPDGTGRNDWNSMETAPLLYVGQILRLVNDDSEPHRLHVPGGGPFRHGDTIPPGAQVEYLVEAPWPLETNARMYDHNYGSSAGFWMQAVE